MNNKQKKTLYIVLFSFIFLIILFFGVNKDTILKNLSGEGDKIRNTVIIKNYREKNTIIIRDDYGKEKEKIILERDIYGKKILTKKTILDKETIYYSNDKDLYIKENNQYKKHSGKIVDNIDLKLLDLDYISSLIGSAQEESRTIDSVTLYNSIENVRIILSFDMNKDLDITTLEKDNYIIISKLYDTDLVKDFDPLKNN